MPKEKTPSHDLRQEAYLLLAFSSSETDYRLAWLLNKALQIALQRDKSIEKKENLTFPVFSTKETNDIAEYTLISNKDKESGSVLLPDYHTVDFFFKINGQFSQERERELQRQIKGIPEIFASIPIAPMKKTALFLFNNL